MKTWRKLACGLLAGTMMLGLAGCAGIDDDTPGAPEPDRPAMAEPGKHDLADDGLREPVREVPEDGRHEAPGVPEAPEPEPGDDPGRDYGNDPEVYYPLAGFDGVLLNYLSERRADGSSFAVSPLSFRAALCLAIAGAYGETRGDLLATAGFGSMAEMETWASKVLASVEEFRDAADRESAMNAEFGGEPADRDYDVLFSVWSNTDRGAGFKESYMEYVSKMLGSEAHEETAGTITDAINAWADSKTRGLIPSLGADFSGCAAVLANAVYLRAPWAEAFQPYATRDEDFRLADGSSISLPTMHMTDSFRYGEYDGGRYLDIPMEGGMHFVVRLGDRMELDPAAFQAACREMRYEEVELAMPKLDLETSWDRGELSGYLRENGAAAALTPDYSSFINMSDQAWHIDEIVQKARLKADEDGLEAAAVTAIMMEVSALAPFGEKEPLEFFLTEPFSFVVLQGDVYDEPEDSLVLFAGRFAGI